MRFCVPLLNVPYLAVMTELNFNETLYCMGKPNLASTECIHCIV